MSETYTSGMWMVKTGEEDAFVADWTAFVQWASGMPGSGTFRLVRDLEFPQRFMSFAPWETFDSQENWKNLPEFRERIGRVISHCDEFKPFTYELVTVVE